MKSPGRAFFTALSMMPAMILPINVVDDSAIAALRRIPIRLNSWPRRALLIGIATMIASSPAKLRASMIS